MLLIILILPSVKARTHTNYEMSQEYNQYGSIALNYDNDEPQFNLFAEEPVAEVVVAKPKLTLKPKRQTKKAVKEVAFAEPVAVVAEVAQQVIPSDCEVVDMSVIEKMIAEAVAPLQQRIKAIEEREDNEPLAPKPTREGRLGYYQVADGDEELKRLRTLNHDLRKEIDAKTKTNQKLQDQLNENPTEVNRLKEMNAALRKERDGARNGRKAAMEYAQKLQRLLEANGIAYEAE